MKPHRPAHVVTSAHREPGGLRKLDFFLDQAESWAGQQKREEINVLVLGWERGDLALPFASLGYRVTVLESDDSSIEACASVSKELGYDIEAVRGSLPALGKRRFQIIVADLNRDVSRLFSSFGDLAEFRFSDGMLLCAVPKSGENGGWNKFRENVKRSGWRIRQAIPQGCLPGRGARKKRNETGERFFHFVDKLDDRLSSICPLRFANGWLSDLEPCEPRKPYVMHLMPGLGFGGAEKVVLELVSRLPDNGFEAKAVAMIAGGPLEQEFREKNIPLEILERRDRFGWSTLRDLRRLFFLQRPDIVHTHLFGADAWGRLAAFLSGVPIILSTEHNINPGYGPFKRFVNRLFARWTDHFVAVSETAKKVMVQKDGIPREKIRVIPNGIDLKEIAPRGARPFRDVPRIICVGRFYEQKDHVTLFKALAKINSPWRLILVGSGPLERELRDIAERLHIAPRIEWLGPRNDVPRILSESDIFCFPSRWEGLGIAALEAAAAGLPLILSDLAPFREIFREDDAVFVRPGDVEAWSKVIRSVLQDPAEAVMRAGRLVPRIKAEFSADKMTASYAALYRKVLRKG